MTVPWTTALENVHPLISREAINVTEFRSASRAGRKWREASTLDPDVLPRIKLPNDLLSEYPANYLVGRPGVTRPNCWTSKQRNDLGSSWRAWTARRTTSSRRWQ